MILRQPFVRDERLRERREPEPLEEMPAPRDWLTRVTAVPTPEQVGSVRRPANRSDAEQVEEARSPRNWAERAVAVQLPDVGEPRGRLAAKDDGAYLAVSEYENRSDFQRTWE